MLCFLETPLLRFALLPCYRRSVRLDDLLMHLNSYIRSFIQYLVLRFLKSFSAITKTINRKKKVSKDAIEDISGDIFITTEFSGATKT